MPMPPKDYKIINCKIDKKIYDEMMKLCEKTGLSKTKAIERALILYYENYLKTGRS